MGLDLDAMCDEVWSVTGTDSGDPQMTRDKVILYLNRSYWELLDKYHFREKDVTETFNTTEGERLYEVPTPFEALQNIAIIDPDTTQSTPLKRMSTEKYNTEYNTDDDQWAIPTHYVREDCAIKLWPTPDSNEYTIVIKYWAVLSDLSEDSNPTPDIPRSWHEIIMYGGVWRAFIALRDFMSANAMKAHQKALIDTMVPVEAKEETHSPNAGLAPQVREYDV